MDLRSYIKKLAGRKGNATHNGTPGSHVNHKANKRTASKAARHQKMLDTAFDYEDNECFDLLTDEEPH